MRIGICDEEDPCIETIPWPRVLDELRRLILLLLGAGLSAVGYAVFQVPYNIAAGGVSGIAILVNHFTGWPVSTFYLVLTSRSLSWASSTWGAGASS